MNKKRLIPFMLISLALTACGGNGMKAPVLKVNSSETGLCWDEVKGAASYEVKVGDDDPYQADAYEFNKAQNTYTVRVRAVNEKGTKFSEYSDPFTYETKQTAIESLTNTDGVVTWTGVVGTSLEVKKDSGEYTPVTGNSYTVTEMGVYTFRAKSGWDGTTNTYYVDGPKATKGIVVSPKATSEYIIEDGSTESDIELQDEYKCMKFQTSVWEEAAYSSVTLSTMNDGVSEGKCISYNYSRQGYYFRFDKDVNFTGGYDTMEFYIKGDGVSTASLAFQITEDRIIGSGENLINMKGAYIAYKIQTVDTAWSKYTISMNDPAWVIDYSGMKLGFADMQTILEGYNFKISSISDLFPLFGQYQVRVMAQPDANYSSTKIYMDDVVLSNKSLNSDSYKVTVLGEKYDVKLNNGAKGTLTTNTPDASHGLFEINGETMPVEMKVEQDILTLTSTTEGKDVIVVLKTEDQGGTFKAVSTRGTLAAIFADCELIPAVTLVDGFERYPSTGVGFDQKNTDLMLRNGLRSEYYSDYYSGATSNLSPMGGNGWQLMGSTDYLDLSVSQAHTGEQSAKAKYNPSAAMRITTWGLYEGNAQPMGKGTTFSLWAKGGSKVDIGLKIRLFKVNQVTKSNHTSDTVSTVKQVTIPKDSDWTEYKVELTPGATYYGFTLTTVAAGGSSGNDYFYIDDISVYTVSPWEA